MEIFLIKLLQFILSISLLVLLHEGGHFFFARIFGIRVEKFYMFFNPGFTLFKFKPKNSDTEYGIGWLPLGGYCKIAGMIDESFDTEQMQSEPQPWEFRTRPAWQRLLVMIGGVLVNFILALFIYSMIMFTWGDAYLAPKDMNMGMQFNAVAQKDGFRNGDIVIAADGEIFERFDVDVYRAVAKAHEVTVLRNGKEVKVYKEDISLLTMLKTTPRYMEATLPNNVEEVLADGPAGKAGMKAGDKIIAVDGKQTNTFNEINNLLGVKADLLEAAVTTKDSLDARGIQVVVAHKDNTIDTLKFQLTEDLKMGVSYKPYQALYKPTTVEYGFFESFPAGVKYGMNVLNGYISDLRYVASSDGVKSLGGFGTLGNLFPSTWDWQIFWNMTAFLSIVLAFMNILPIPALDGGHALFLIYEMIFRRKPSDKFMLYAEYVGFAILVLLMLIANGNDVLRWIGLM